MDTLTDLRARSIWTQCVAASLLAATLLVATLGGCGSSGHRAGPRPPAATGRTPVPSPPALPAPTGVVYGINVNRLFNERTYSPAQIDTQLRFIAASGVTIARSDALWEFSEPQAPVNGVHTYDWRFDDTIAANLAAHGMTWLPIVDYTAVWSQGRPGTDHGPPASNAAYAAYAAAVARRYGPGGAFWTAHPGLAPQPVAAIEIWNEPDNHEFWQPTPDPVAYAGLYIAARDAIAAAVPAMRVLVGGLTDPPGTLRAMLSAHPELVGHIDGIAVHPYGLPLQMLAKLRDDRQAMTALGLGAVPLYVTEFGWVIHPRGALGYVPAAQRPADIRSALIALGHLNCGLAGVIYYTWITPERNPADREDWFGIQPADGRVGPDRTAFVAGVRGARAPGATQSVCAPG